MGSHKKDSVLNGDNNAKLEIFAKTSKYVRKYNNIAVIYFKLLISLIINIFHVPVYFGKEKVQPLDKKFLRIAVRMDGGLGDMLVYSVWIKEFSKIVGGDFLIDVFGHKNSQISYAVSKDNTYVNKVYDRRLLSDNLKKYDIAITFRRFPLLLWANLKRVKKFSPNLLNFLEQYNRFKNDYAKFFYFNSSADTQVDLYTICRGEKRIQQPDINNLLGISEATKYYLHLDEDAFDVLKKNGLNNQKYITVTRSVELTQKHKANIRLWPLEYYESLIVKLKQRYPDVKIVQLGADRCESIKGVDVDLLGKTTLEEVKVLLKYSLLHIDGECGMVHAKHFLGGKSAVFFGQTAIEYLGYDNNINLKSDACPHWCEWIADDWQTHCIRGFEVPPCMTELKPKYAFENIVPYLDKVVNRLEKNIEIVKIEDVDTFLAEKNLKNLKVMFYGMEFYNLAKELCASNSVTLYDSKLKNKDINEAKALGIELDYGDIYNIPDVEGTFDVVCVSSERQFNNEFMMKELKRVSKKMILIVGEKHEY
ncbi:hypothetical protein J6E39_04955 [bacterium]|nr:hypothetical protein [bacterium]